MQSAYIGKLMEIAEQDHNVLHVLADSGTGYDEMFRRYFPDQILNFGISEEHMVAAAAGMATVGKIPFVFTAGAFLAYRSLEFIRDDVCFQNQNVKIVGMGSGLSWSSLGPTHHTTEDIGVLRTLPNLMLLSPATPRQTAKCVKTAYEHNGPVYIRIGMNHEKEFFDETYMPSDNGTDTVIEGSDILIYCTGSILEEVVEAAGMLRERGVSAKVINVWKIKPFVANLVAEGYGKVIFTVEEHNIRGGLGSIIAEQVAYHGLGGRVIPIGIEDAFAVGYGTHRAVRAVNGLDAAGVFGRIMGVLNE